MNIWDKLEFLLRKKNYKAYNRLLQKQFKVDPVVTGPERKGGQRVLVFDPDWFEYHEL